MATKANIRTDPNKQHWEDSEFPILCQTCLGDNPYIRMTKEKFGKECKICTRPFTVFRWCPGKGMRFKKTEVCQTCAKLKNVCQTCIFDLEYGLPVQVRDKALGIADNMPKSDVNREFYAQNMDKMLSEKEAGALAIDGGGKASPAGIALLKQLARNNPYYKRNRAHICSFWVKGECKRGEECPYRHEMPTDPNNPLAQQNIKDRFYGSNDPVAEKMFVRAENFPKLEVPEDQSVMSLYVGGLDSSFTEEDLRSHFYQYGEIDNIVCNKGTYAFVTFKTRQAAEQAAERSFNQLIMKGKKLKVMWGRSQSQQANEAGEKGGIDLVPVPGLPVPSMPHGEFKRPIINAAPPVVFPTGVQPMPPPPPGLMVPPPPPFPLQRGPFPPPGPPPFSGPRGFAPRPPP
eukprot:Ihof_evm9s79 gene=Ihof_evmTU9s79